MRLHLARALLAVLWLAAMPLHAATDSEVVGLAKQAALGKDEAHQLLEEASRTAHAQGRDLQSVLAADPRVLLIGDSISMGYTLGVRARLAGKANVHRPPENCGDTARGVKSGDTKA